MRRRSATMWASMAGVAAMVATACGSTGTSSPTSGAANTPTATAAATGKSFGTTLTAAGGAMYTVLAFQMVQPKGGAATPNPGGAFFAANVQECAGSGPALTTDPTAWLAVFSGNNQAQGRDATTVATAGPPLATGATVSAGQCAGGWVAFTGFADGIGREVHINGVDSWWQVP